MNDMVQNVSDLNRTQVYVVRGGKMQLVWGHRVEPWERFTTQTGQQCRFELEPTAVGSIRGGDNFRYKGEVFFQTIDGSYCRLIFVKDDGVERLWDAEDAPHFHDPDLLVGKFVVRHIGSIA